MYKPCISECRHVFFSCVFPSSNSLLMISLLFNFSSSFFLFFANYSFFSLLLLRIVWSVFALCSLFYGWLWCEHLMCMILFLCNIHTTRLFYQYKRKKIFIHTSKWLKCKRVDLVELKNTSHGKSLKITENFRFDIVGVAATKQKYTRRFVNDEYRNNKVFFVTTEYHKIGSLLLSFNLHTRTKHKCDVII